MVVIGGRGVFLMSEVALQGVPDADATATAPEVDDRPVCIQCLEQLLRRNVKRFRGGLLFKAHILVYQSTLGWRVLKQKQVGGTGRGCDGDGARGRRQARLGRGDHRHRRLKG